MCGIIGQVSFNGLQAALPQLSLLHHRGPDDSGEWMNTTGTIYLGHTRLAILDPSPTGKQPMQDASRRFTITFNGEIYNHLQLRRLLPEVNWRGRSDTETLLELYAAKGLAALELLKGMFAFALHDAADDSILLVRDRLGIKPLWFQVQQGAIRFSSEIRALLLPGKLKLTPQALGEYIAYGRMPGVGEIFEGIEPVAPGGWLKIEADKKMTWGSWWPNNSFARMKCQSRQECSQQVKQLVSTAIEEHLLADTEVGAFLSGGIDSSIVTLVAGKVLGKKLKTFTVGFPQKVYDERAVAKIVAAKAGTEHVELEVNLQTCLEWVQTAVGRLDLPSVDAINTYIISKAVRNTGIKVALSGLGGDELFGGYPSFYSVPWLRRLSYLPVNLRESLINMLPKSIHEKLGGLEDFSVVRLTHARRRFTSINHLKVIGLGHGSPAIPPVPAGLDTMGAISWTEIYGYMIPMLLRDSDQMSMAVGLEIRVPFLDHRVVEEVLAFSQQYKKGSGTKPLLLEAFRYELPREVYERPKQGFVLPMTEWIRGPLAAFTSEGVAIAADFLALTEPMRQLENFQKGGLHWTRVWHWAVLGHWMAKQEKLVNLAE